MVSVLQTIDTNHHDIVHDAKMDFYGTTLATASSDCSVKIFSVKNKKQVLKADLRQHQGPVWGLAWSHPIFGGLLASCSYDKTVIIWSQVNGTWTKTHTHTLHESSVNSVCWAPHEYGLILACGSSDGTISILECTQSNQWESRVIKDAHALGVNAVSWAPAINVYALLKSSENSKTFKKRLVSGGCDSVVKIWCESAGEGGAPEWTCECSLEAHQDWVRDVSWAPSLTPQRQQVASCGQDGRVIVWQYLPPPSTSAGIAGEGCIASTDVMQTTNWRPIELHTYPESVWHCDWSLTGNMLAVSGADNTVTLWKENLEGRWVAISEIQRGHGAGQRAEPSGMLQQGQQQQLSNAPLTRSTNAVR